MTKVELEVWALIWATQKWVISWISKAIDILEKELKALTPEDTKEMLRSYVKQLKTTDSEVIGQVWNTSKHAIFVEYGVEGKQYNYHKPKWNVFYKWVWNRTFARAIDNKKQDILSIIQKEIWKQ